MCAYSLSLDLRQRVIDLVLSGLSYPQVAEVLRISPATVKRYVRRYRTHGDLTPRPRTGRPSVNGAALDAGLVPQLQAQPDATLAEHCRQWQADTGMVVSVSTMRRAVCRARWTLKISLPSPASAPRSSASPG
jgi:transposase